MDKLKFEGKWVDLLLQDGSSIGKEYWLEAFDENDMVIGRVRVSGSEQTVIELHSKSPEFGIKSIEDHAMQQLVQRLKDEGYRG